MVGKFCIWLHNIVFA